MFVLYSVIFLCIQSHTVLTSTTSEIFEYKNKVNHLKIFDKLLVSGSYCMPATCRSAFFSQIIKFLAGIYHLVVMSSLDFSCL